MSKCYIRGTPYLIIYKFGTLPRRHPSRNLQNLYDWLIKFDKLLYVIMWHILEHKDIAKQCKKAPQQVLKKYELWKNLVFRHGPDILAKFPGFNDEKLKGKRKGQRSSRLNLKYRVIYSVSNEGIIVYVLEITPHKYWKQEDNMLKKDFTPAKRRADVTTGDVIRLLRELKGWTQEKLAELSGINAKNISLLENNKIDIGKKRAEQIANAFGIHPSIIMFPEYEADLIQMVA